MAFKISVVGTGYVGIVSGTTFAAHGNSVICVDIDEQKVQKMREGIPPIYEPGLEWLLKNNIEGKRLFFTTKLKEAVENTDIIFLCLPTPPDKDGAADLQNVLATSKEIAEIIRDNNLSQNKIIVDKSTVPVGTGEKVKKIFDEILPNNEIEVVSNPEFLSEGTAVEEAMKPDRVVIGTNSQRVRDIMKELYEPFLRSGNPLLFMDIRSAEITKYAANSMLALRISFMNELARYCDNVEADIDLIRLGIGLDPRIGKRYLYAGLGYGGSCLPKDVKALIHSANEANTPIQLVQTAFIINETQVHYFFSKITNRFGSLNDLHFAVWGLSFKPNTDDIRESPALRIIDLLLSEGATVSVYDPQAIEKTRELYTDRINYGKDQYEILAQADALILATEWSIFRKPEFDKVKQELKNPIIFDGRNQYDPDEMQNLGFEYYPIGRKRII
ncbi:MAG TPA: UDP-glucose/GDP-mannose dehydrogenase family protein [Bacteroidota bacterium]|nr:UDP-glucose/GDP-mannose dehydrogenase family protein [Bacteroidota bacterium]